MVYYFYMGMPVNLEENNVMIMCEKRLKIDASTFLVKKWSKI